MALASRQSSDAEQRASERQLIREGDWGVVGLGRGTRLLGGAVIYSRGYGHVGPALSVGP